MKLVQENELEKRLRLLRAVLTELQQEEHPCWAVTIEVTTEPWDPTQPGWRGGDTRGFVCRADIRSEPNKWSMHSCSDSHKTPEAAVLDLIHRYMAELQHYQKCRAQRFIELQQQLDEFNYQRGRMT